MRDWIVGLQKSATEARPPAGAETIATVEAALGQRLPDELRDLYEQMDGGAFPADIAIHAAGGALRERSAEALPGFGTAGVLRFGQRGSDEHLFAARKDALSAQTGGFPLPTWVEAFPAEGWVYGILSEHDGELKVYRSLEKLLWSLIPPTETEDFGENTFVRALSAVESALETIKDVAKREEAAAGEGEEEVAPVAAPKAAPKKTAAKPAPKAVVKAAPKKAAAKAAKKPAALKPVALKPAALKPAALKPVALKPVALKPAALKPAALKPVAKAAPKTAAKKAAPKPAAKKKPAAKAPKVAPKAAKKSKPAKKAAKPIAKKKPAAKPPKKAKAGAKRGAGKKR